jgi:membrane protease YdiL (CAAX protease family)
LAVLVPVLGYVRFRQFAARDDQVVSKRTKLIFYGRIVCFQWLLVGAMLVVIRRHGLSVANVGERLGDADLTFGVTGVLLLVLAVVSAIVLMRRRHGRPGGPTATVGRLQKLVPAFGLEMTVFVVVCLTAGVCEELLYRGWLVNFLRAATGSAWAAVVVSAVLFGIGHAYQGTWAMLRTAFVGLQLAILFVAVGSLIPGQVLHAGVDLLAGVAGALAVSRLSASAGKQRA